MTSRRSEICFVVPFYSVFDRHESVTRPWYERRLGYRFRETKSPGVAHRQFCRWWRPRYRKSVPHSTRLPLLIPPRGGSWESKNKPKSSRREICTLFVPRLTGKRMLACWSTELL